MTLPTTANPIPLPSATRPALDLSTALNKVPAVTLLFWVVKVLATTVGETAADFLNGTVGLGLTGTSLVMSALLAVALVAQFRTRRYVAGVYWTTVVLISVVGTLVTDNLTDNLGVPLTLTTAVFSVLLAVVFAVWWRTERTLSVHAIRTPRREAFYWFAIGVTFALGTAAGDLVGERLAVGYLLSAVLFGVVIGAVWLGHRLGLLGPVLAFWSAYILTRPLGASFGDLLSQGRGDGGLGLGTSGTSAVFLLGILAAVVWWTRTAADVEPADREVLAARS